MAESLGVSLVGLKRFEKDARPIPAYIDHSAQAIMLCHTLGIFPMLDRMFQESLSGYSMDTIIKVSKQNTLENEHTKHQPRGLSRGACRAYQ